MTPSALSAQLQHGPADFLRFSFWSSTPGMEHVVEDLLAEPGALLMGPCGSLRLPFVAGTDPCIFPKIPLGFTPHAHEDLGDFLRFSFWLSTRRMMASCPHWSSPRGPSQVEG